MAWTRDPNETVLEKTIEPGDIVNGGQLNPEQQETFVTLVRKYATILPQVRFVRMEQPNVEIDKLHIGEPVTISVDANTDPAVLQKPKFNKISLSAKKIQSAWNISTEVLQANIEQDGFEESVMNAFVERIATDLELLAIRGDTALTGTNPEDLLLKRLDGWAKKTDSAHIYDAQAQTISKSIFAVAKRRLPKHFKADPGLRYLVSDAIAIDWMDTVSDRATIAGDAALQGSGVAPYGIPMILVPLIPDDLTITVSEATVAEFKTLRAGPFTFSSSNKVLKLDVDNTGYLSITFTEGTADGVSVVKQLNAAFVTNSKNAVAYDDGEGFILIRGTTAGASGELDYDATADGSTANTPFGLDSAGVTVVGAAAGAGTAQEGSFVWLLNPKNLIWGILDDTRMFTEFNKNYDRIETVMYNQVAADVENLDAVVKVKNVRKKPEA